MDELVNKLNKLLASSFTMYLKAHNFHWNVEDQDFPQYHEFFGNLYEEVYGSVDSTAEQIRALGGYAKGSLTDFKELSTVRDQVTIPGLQEMVAILNRDNDAVIAVLNEVHDAATTAKEYGLINYIEGRIDTHKKHGWMLRASMKKQVDEQVRTYSLNIGE
jgi:starvation-inducible DNA-binding protein